MRSDGKFCFREKERHFGIMNEENYWDHNVESDSVESPLVCVSGNRMVLVLNESRKMYVSLELIAGSGKKEFK